MARTRGMTEVGARRREQILCEAEALIESVGFDDLTMEAIADSIGIAKSTLYHYFPQKDDMLLALHEKTMREQIDHLTAIVESTTDTTEILRLAMLDQVRLIAEHPGRVRALMDARRDEGRQYHAQMAALERVYIDQLVEVLKRGIAGDELRPARPVLVVEAMIGMTQHARYWLRPDRPGGYEAVAGDLWALLRDGLVAPTNGSHPADPVPAVVGAPPDV